MPRTSPPRWLRRLLRALAGFALGVVMLLSFTAVALWSLRKKIVDRELTNLLRAPVSFELESLVIAPAYPVLELRLHDVILHSNSPHYPNAPFRINEAVLRVNPFKIFFEKDHKRVERLHFRGVETDLTVGRMGMNNYAFFHGYDPERRVPKVVKIPQLSLEDAEIRYHFVPGQANYRYTFDSLRMRMEIHKHDIQMQLGMRGYSHYMSEDDFAYLQNRPFHIEADAEVDKTEKALNIRESSIGLDGNLFHLSGRVPVGPGRFYDVQFEAPESDIEALLSLIPRGAGEQLRSFHPKGRFRFSGMLRGVRDPNRPELPNPHFEMHFQSRQLSIDTKMAGMELSGLAFQGFFTNGPENRVATTSLRIDSLRGKLNGHPLAADFSLSAFNDLKLAGNLRTSLPTTELLDLAELPYDTAAGRVHLSAKLVGRLRRMRELASFAEVGHDGQVRLDSVVYHPGGIPLTLDGLNGGLDIRNDTLHIDSLNGVVNNQQLTVSGRMDEFFSYLAGTQSDLTGAARLHFQALNVDSLLATLEGVSARLDTNRAPDTARQRHWLDLQLPDGLNLRTSIAADGLRYHEAHFDSLWTHLRYRNRRLSMPALELYREKDSLMIDLFLQSGRRGRQSAELNIAGSSLDLERLLSDLSGQQQSLMPGSALQVGGHLQLQAEMLNSPAVGEPPPMKINLLFRDGFFRQDSGKLDLTGLSLQTRLDERHLTQPQQQSWYIDSIAGRANGYPFVGSLHVKDLISKETRLSLASGISFPAFTNYFEIDNLVADTGFINFAGDIHGPYPSFFRIDSLVNLSGSGNIQLKNIGGRFANRGLGFSDVNAIVNYDDAAARLDTVHGNLGQTHLHGYGRFRDILPFLFLERQPLKADLSLFGDTLDLQQWLSVNPRAADSAHTSNPLGDDLATEAQPSDSAGSEDLLFKVPIESDVRLRTQLDHVRSGRFRADSLNLFTTVVGRQIDLHDLHFNFGGGRVNLYGSVDASNRDSMLTSLAVYLQAVRVNDLLYTFDNFNQQLLTAEQIRGRLTAEMSYLDVVPPSLQPSFEQTQAELDFRISEGRLTGFKPLLELHPVINRKYLHDVKFQMEAPNWRLADGKLLVPALRLHSNILEMRGKGWHTIDNEMEYRLVVSPKRVEQKVLRSRFFNLFSGPPSNALLGLLITGTGQDPEIKLDTERLFRELPYQLFLR